VWHTKTVTPVLSLFRGIPKSLHDGTNLGPLNKYWCLYIGAYPCGFRWKEMNKQSNANNNKKTTNMFTKNDGTMHNENIKSVIINPKKT
jgi:hypothetical protein